MNERQQAGIDELRQSRKHIVVINVEPMFLDVARELLQMEHFNVTTTTFLPKTFEAILGFEPDLIMLDLYQGEHAGWEMLTNLAGNAVTRDIPVIVSSTKQTLLDQAQTTFAPYKQYRLMIVPFDLDALLNAVNELIGGA